MQRGLGGAAFEPVPQSRDRELTLGPFALILLGCGLFGLCALCFVFGYAAGHRGGDSSTASLPEPGTPAIAQPSNPQSKPSAGLSGAQSPQQTSPSDPAGGESAAGQPSEQPEAAAAESPVRPVLSQAAAAQAVPASLPVQPAIGAQAAGPMVQIAAVSQPEDADVLVGALRKRGYAVAARRDPADGLLHVQVGPFANRNDANAMRQKLLNDGYNAVVQP